MPSTALSSSVRAVPAAPPVALQEGGDPAPSWLDTARLRADTGFTPAWDLDPAVADYVAWLRSGHHR
ncbi:hypothetical protein ABZS66_57465 [Dactylosporangium sp. NPDC005572]|uniref:hypothetical protein n=1 Tax=Dactylosporangium sp. NPDC005572 TaxID=3156889 RepID=UPI0033A0DAEB